MSDSSERVTCRHMLMYDSDDSFSDPDEAIDNYYEMLAAYDDSEEAPTLPDIDYNNEYFKIIYYLDLDDEIYENYNIVDNFGPLFDGDLDNMLNKLDKTKNEEKYCSISDLLAVL